MRFTIATIALISLLTGCASTEVARQPTASSQPSPGVCTFCPVVSPSDCKLCVESNPLLTVDKDGVTSGTLRVCNRDVMPVTLALDISDFHVRDPQGSLYPLSAVRSLAAAAATSKAIVDGGSPLAVNACVDVKVDASRIWQAGLATADLKNRSDTLVKVHAVRYQVPFNLKVDGPTTEMVNVGFTRGRESVIRLRNEDGMAYRFLWNLELGEATHNGEGFVPANGLAAIPVTLASSNFSFLESGFLRSADRTGTLTLSYQPDASFRVLPLPQKRYPVTARLSFFGETLQRITNYVWVLLILLAGIVVSLLVNHVLPLQKKRVEIKLRLAALEGRLSGLGGVVDSRILNLLRVEKKRLREALNELQALVPQSAVELPKLEARIDWLVQRIDLTSATGDLLEAVDSGSHDLALPEADAIRDHCREVLQIVGKNTATPEDVQIAQKNLSLASTVLDGADQEPSDAAVEALKIRIEEVLKEVPGDLTQPAWAPFQALFPNLTRQLAQLAHSEKMSRNEYVRQASLVRKAELVREFVRNVESSPSEEVRKKRMHRAGELVTALEPGPDESIRVAQGLVRQVEQNVTKGDLVSRIKACDSTGCMVHDDKESESKRLMWVEIDPPTPFTYQLVTFRVRFDRTALDCAVAQNQIECKWMVRPASAPEREDSWVDAEIAGASAERRFSGANGRQLSGWLIGYYFVGEREWQRVWRKVVDVSAPRNVFRSAAKIWRTKDTETTISESEETFIVKAYFPELNKSVVSAPVTLERTKAYVESRTILAVVSLVITILIVAFGLLAGAQEKLQTLDWISGVVAVLVLGFGADTLKNLITRT